MTIEKVIEVGKSIEFELGDAFYYIPHWLDVAQVVVFGVAFAFLALMSTARSREVGEMFGVIAGIFVALTLVVSLGSVLVGAGIGLADEKEKLHLWDMAYVVPYVTTLESEKVPIKSVKAGNSLGKSHDSVFLNDEDKKHIMSLKLSVDKKHEFINRGKFIVKRDVKSEKDMYLEYKNVKKDLGKSRSKGVYNPVVHITKDTKL